MSINQSLAKFTPQISVESRKGQSSFVLVNGRRAMEILTPMRNLSPSERATITSTRLTDMLGAGVDPKSIRWKKVGNSNRVVAQDAILTIVTPAEALAHKVPADKLADDWARNLRSLLMMPPLGVTPKTLLVPLGETRTTVVESLLADPVQIEVVGTCIAVDSLTTPGVLTVSGVSTGDATINVRCGEYTEQVQVSVRKYAAYSSSDTQRAIVTGNDIPHDVISQAVSEAACQTVTLSAGATIRSIDIPHGVRAPSPGKSTPVTVTIQTTGTDYIPAKLVVPVNLENQALSVNDPAQIMYSNNPERFVKYQTLFAGKLTPTDTATRLLYHHQNAVGKTIGFVIDLLNTSDSPATVHTITGISNPMIDTWDVGYKAGLGFLVNLRNGAGRVVDVPAHSRRVIVSQSLSNLYSASGVLELHQLSGQPLLVRVIARPEDQRIVEDQPEMTMSTGELAQSDITLSDAVFPKPTRKLNVSYKLGGPWMFQRIGDLPLKHAALNQYLYGNYGVIYEISATLENPTPTACKMEIAFEATAGTASGVFFVDDSIAKAKFIKQPNEEVIGRVTVPAEKSRIVSIRTMPLSGSFYPATIIIRPVSAAGMTGSAK